MDRSLWTNESLANTPTPTPTSHDVPKSNHAALVATCISFVWCFVLLVRFSDALPEKHGAVLGMLLIATTLILLSEVVRSLVVDVWVDTQNRREAARDEAGVEIELTPTAPGGETESVAADPTETRIVETVLTQVGESSERPVLGALSGSWEAGSIMLCGGNLPPSDLDSTETNDSGALTRRIEALVNQLAQKEKQLQEKDVELHAARALISDGSGGGRAGKGGGGGRSLFRRWLGE